MGSVDTFECAHTEGTVDTLSQGAPEGVAKKKQRRRTIKERKRPVVTPYTECE